jgi:hypothetical protein
MLLFFNSNFSIFKQLIQLTYLFKQISIGINNEAKHLYLALMYH